MATERHGNIGAGGVLVALAEAWTERVPPPGSTLLLAALGGGLC